MSARQGRRWLGSLVAASLLAASCTGVASVLPSAKQTSPAAPSLPAGTGTSIITAQHNPLCQYSKPPTSPGPTSASLPPAFQRVADQVQQVRGLRFAHPVVPEPVTQQQLNASIGTLAAESLPKKLVDDEGRAWITIGVLPKGTDLRAALLRFYGSQILGYYDSDSRRLVFTGSSAPSPYQMFVLSHELTHALDDQRLHFGPLVDHLDATCQDERAAGFQALIEGNAVATSVSWAERFLSQSELAKLNQEASQAPPTTGIPPFVLRQEAFPYTAGPAFVHALQARGGEGAVNAAFRNPPVSTEQILHPSLYPSDTPVPVVVPNLSRKLGNGWHLIDQLQPGEDWFRLMLALHLPESRAASAASGWGGAEYRAWSQGSRTAVLMKTVWDSAPHANVFAAAVKAWLPPAGSFGLVESRGTRVNLLFASDRATLARLRAGVAA